MLCDGNTPPQNMSLTVGGGGAANAVGRDGRNLADAGGGYAAADVAVEPTAFSVLPDDDSGAVRDDPKPCDCPDCRKKPLRLSSKCDINIILL